MEPVLPADARTQPLARITPLPKDPLTLGPTTDRAHINQGKRRLHQQQPPGTLPDGGSPAADIF